MHSYRVVASDEVQHLEGTPTFDQKIIGYDFQPIERLTLALEVRVMLCAQTQAKARACCAKRRRSLHMSPIVPLEERHLAALTALNPWPLQTFWPLQLCSAVLQSLLPLQSWTL